MRDIKLKLINRDNSVVVMKGKGRGLVKGKGGQIYGGRRWFDCGLWAHNAIFKSHVIEMYT